MWWSRGAFWVGMIAAGLLPACAGDVASPIDGGTPPGSEPIPNVQVGFVDRSVVDSGTTYRYKIFVPRAYTPTQKWPVILFLHGAGELGTDNDKQTRVGLGAVVRAQEATFPAVVVFPQLNTTGPGSRLRFQRLADAALSTAMRDFNGDPSRVYQTGMSMGATWGWELPLANPNRFAAIAPVAGGICVACVAGLEAAAKDPTPVYRTVGQQLHDVRFWFFHGDSDPSSPVAEVEAAVQAFRDVGVDVRFTKYPKMGHNVWDATYSDPAFMTWLLAQKRSP